MVRCQAKGSADSEYLAEFQGMTQFPSRKAPRGLTCWAQSLWWWPWWWWYSWAHICASIYSFPNTSTFPFHFHNYLTGGHPFRMHHMRFPARQGSNWSASQLRARFNSKIFHSPVFLYCSTWMDLEMIILSEFRQRQISYVIAYMQNL